MLRFRDALLAGWLLAAMAGPAGAGPTMDISDAWVREAPPTARVLAAYMQITNLSDSEFTITAVTSPDFAAAELHRTAIEDGVARMLPVAALTIPAGDSVRLEPGGLHLMLYDPVQSLVQGDSVALVLHRSDGICLTAAVPVRRATEAGHEHHHHH